ncbi:MAG: restriction endonuclease subunit S, partial [bacterium]
MIRNLTAYPAYKDSGVPWLGRVPEHWELKPLKRWVRINESNLPETTPADYEFKYIDIGTVGTGFLIREPQQMRFGGAPSRARRVLRRGDTIVSTVRTYLKAVYHVARDANALVCSTGFVVLTAGPGTHPKYVSYLAK